MTKKSEKERILHNVDKMMEAAAKAATLDNVRVMVFINNYSVDFTAQGVDAADVFDQIADFVQVVKAALPRKMPPVPKKKKKK